MCNVVFIELCSFIVAHRTRNRQFKVRLSKRLNHFPNKLLDLCHLCLDILNLRALLIISTVRLLYLPAKTYSCFILISFTHRPQRQMVIDLVSNLLVLLLNHVDVRVEHVDVVV